jgi:Asparagine synthase (glutamine-hydrolyzing)
MSGIVGMLNLDGSPVDGVLLRRMTRYLAFRGPDRQALQVMNHVGLGQALLATTEESEREQQPFTLDGRRWMWPTPEWMPGRTSSPSSERESRRRSPPTSRMWN